MLQEVEGGRDGGSMEGRSELAYVPHYFPMYHSMVLSREAVVRIVDLGHRCPTCMCTRVPR